MARLRPRRTLVLLPLHPLHAFVFLHLLAPRIRDSPSRLPPRVVAPHYRERCGELGVRRVWSRESREMDWRDAEEVEEVEGKEKGGRESLQGDPEEYGRLRTRLSEP